MKIYLPNPDPERVLIEQFAYLLEHRKGCEIFHCADCGRFHEAVRVFHAPFRTVAFPRTSETAVTA